MPQPPLPGRQCTHHWFSGFSSSRMGRSLQHSEHDPHARPVTAVLAAMTSSIDCSVLTFRLRLASEPAASAYDPGPHRIRAVAIVTEPTSNFDTTGKITGCRRGRPHGARLTIQTTRLADLAEKNVRN